MQLVKYGMGSPRNQPALQQSIVIHAGFCIFTNRNMEYLFLKYGNESFLPLALVKIDLFL